MNQRVRVLQELGEEFERALVAAPAGSVRVRTPRIHLGGAVVMLSSVVAMGIAVAGIAVLGHGRQDSPGAVAVAGASERQLLDRYAVLRRPQTAADRALAGRLPNLNRRARWKTYTRTLNGHVIVHGHVQTVPNPTHFTDVPSLTRVVARADTKITLFVVRATPNYSRGAAPGALKGYLLLARVARSRGVTLVAAPRGMRQSFELRAVLPTVGDTTVSVVPDSVASVRWSWPRQFDPNALKFVAALTIKAGAHDNVASARTTRAVPPLTTTWYGGDGRVIERQRDPNAAYRNGSQYAILGGSTPGPATPRSRRAERDPSTSNPVFVVPATGTTSTNFDVYFRALLSGQRYGMRLTGGPHRACAPNYAGDILSSPSVQPFLRGHIVQSVINGVGCPGTYRLSMFVLGKHNRPYPPFGSATFAAR